MVISSKTAQEIDTAKEVENLKKVEAILFVSGRFLNMSELISLSDLNPIIIRELIDKLKEKYETSDSAIEIVKKGDNESEMWKMDVGQEFSYIINKLATGSAEFSGAEQETLAIIAFKQPIKQSVVIKIRGNKAYDHIKKFVDLELVKRKRSGRTHELSLSDEFYDYFSVKEGSEFKESDIRKISGEVESEEKREENQGEDGEKVKNIPPAHPQDTLAHPQEEAEEEDLKRGDEVSGAQPTHPKEIKQGEN